MYASQVQPNPRAPQKTPGNNRPQHSGRTRTGARHRHMSTHGTMTCTTRRGRADEPPLQRAKDKSPPQPEEALNVTSLASYDPSGSALSTFLALPTRMAPDPRDRIPGPGPFHSCARGGT